jgi:hypothetical protein
MITRGSKFFYGAAAVSLLTALVYGFITGAAAHGGVLDVFSNGGLVNSIIGPLSFGWKGWVGDQVGYSVFMGFAAVMAVLGGFQSAFRDGDAEALVQIQGPGVTAETADLRVVQPQGLSYWPIVAAFSLGAVIVGLAVSSIVFVIGCLGLGIAGIEWTVRAWSERASDDAAANVELRNKFMHPIEVPAGATLAAAAVIFLMSRILLAVSKVGAVFVIIGVAVAVFGVAVLLASRPQLKRSVLVGALLGFGVLLIAGGIVGGVAGPAEREHHGEEHGTEEGTPAVVIESDHGVTSGSIGLDGSTVGY